MLRVFVGHDARESVGLHVFLESLLEHASRPVAVTVITEKLARRLGVGTDGSNAFTKSRFLVPFLCDYRGFALWLDGADMMVRSDINGILQALDFRSAVQVVKHAYTPKAKRKYVGTPMESENVPYPMKNWSSAMLLWCEHSACRRLTPDFVAKSPGRDLHQLHWVQDDARIGDLPIEWNWLDEYGEMVDAKLVHYTNGIPGFAAYRHAPHADEWRRYAGRAVAGAQG